MVTARQRMLVEYTPLADAAKAKGLKGRKQYFYVFFLGTHPDARQKGLASAIMREYQARAAKEGVPLWLEATTAYSMRLYERLGFRIVDEMVLGKGKVDADGLECKGGEGVKIWGMIWEAEEVKEAAS
jgi:GNAT superfamily N-acetyltransferase